MPDMEEKKNGFVVTYRIEMRACIGYMCTR